MRLGFTPIRRRFERLFATVSAVAVLMSMMVVFAPAALAHHPEIDAYQTCLDQGLVIHFDAISWRTDGGSGSGHSDIRIEVRVNGSGPWVEVDSGAFTGANNYRFSGNFDASPYQGTSVQVRARADGAWSNGQGGGETRQTTAFAVDLNCNEDATPVDPVITGSEVCGVADSLLVPNTPGVNYLLGNDVVNGDTITGPASGVLTAAAQAGFELTDPSWSFAFDLGAGDPCPGVVDPVDPVVTISEVCGVADSLLVPNTPGVNYLLGNDVVNGDTITGAASGVLTAVAQAGFELTDPSWSFAFDLGAGDPCPGVVTPVAPTIVVSTVCEVEGSVTFPVTTGHQLRAQWGQRERANPRRPDLRNRPGRDTAWLRPIRRSADADDIRRRSSRRLRRGVG